MADVASAAPVRPETRFQIGSISKSFAAIVAMQEVDAGRLDLHVSVNELLPWLAAPRAVRSDHDASPAHAHRRAAHRDGGRTRFRGRAAAPPHRTRRRAPPGERFHYSNDGYKIVGAVLEDLTGLPIHELLRDRLLGPLGMTSSVAAITDDIWTDHATGYEPMLTDRPAQLRHPLVPAPRIVSNTADGSIVSTVVDMCAYARLLLARGDRPDGRGGRILSEEGFARLMATRSRTVSTAPTATGCGTRTSTGRTWLGHTGGMVGYTALLTTRPGGGHRAA